MSAAGPGPRATVVMSRLAALETLAQQELAALASTLPAQTQEPYDPLSALLAWDLASVASGGTRRNPG